MKKRVKVFEKGKHKNLDFTIDKVKNIFGKVKDKVDGIYIHTSEWKKTGKDPVSVCEFSNFDVDDKGVAYADAELNTKGLEFNKDGLFKGISVEIGKDNVLSKIALLPLGVNPAIKGAEFSEDGEYYTEAEEFSEFEEGEIAEMKIETMTIDEKLKFIKELSDSITPEQKKVFRTIAYEFQKATEEEENKMPMTKEEMLEFAKREGFDIEVKEKAKPKTEAEMRAEIKLEFEAEKKADLEFSEFEKIVEKNVLPGNAKAYLDSFKLHQGNTDVIEFSETEKCTELEHLKAKVSKMNEREGLTTEFSRQDGKSGATGNNKIIEAINAEAEKTSKMYGGK